jgi:hypothetical protein
MRAWVNAQVATQAAGAAPTPYAPRYRDR